MTRSAISLDDVTPNNLGVLKKIVEVCLPTEYPDAWYDDALNKDQIVTLAFYSELPIGALKARAINKTHEPRSLKESKVQKITESVPNAVYMDVLAVLPAYRRLGIGQKLLDYLIDETKKRFIHEIILHTNTENDDAIQWYLKRGFEKIEEVPNYYTEQGLENANALVLSLKV